MFNQSDFIKKIYYLLSISILLFKIDYFCIVLTKVEIHKKIRKSVQQVGVQRFFTALILILAGLIWKFFQVSNDSESGLTLKKLISFWPLFWALWLGLGFLWWVLSGFKSVNGLIFSFAGGAFMAETVLPGVVMNTDNAPFFIILIGLFLFALPRKSYVNSAYSYGRNSQSDNSSKKRSSRIDANRQSLSEIKNKQIPKS